MSLINIHATFTEKIIDQKENLSPPDEPSVPRRSNGLTALDPSCSLLKEE